MNQSSTGATFNRSLSRRQACGLGLAGIFALACAPTFSFAEEAAKAEDAAEALAISFPVTVVDDQDREVTVESLDSVVACMGSFAKMWELAGGSLVGVTDDALADYELESAPNATSVGDFTAPNLEQILALSPTLVILSASSAGRGGTTSVTDLVAPLEAAGIPVLTFKVTTFPDYLRMLRTCCDLTGREDLYQANGSDVEARVNAIVEAVKPAQEALEAAPTCLLMTTYSGGTRVLASTTQGGAILADLGAANLAEADPSLLSDYSLEAVIAQDPDFIFVTPMGDDVDAAEKALFDQTEANPAWAGLTAVAEGRYVVLDPALFQYKPLNVWDQAYAFMAKTLYGEDVLEGLDLGEADETAKAETAAEGKADEAKTDEAKTDEAKTASK